MRVVRDYASDETNSETVTTLQLHIGAGSSLLAVATGIHWHVNVDNEIEYVTTDTGRENIPYVRLRDRQGNVREFIVEGTTPGQLAAGTRRRMDCMDCHNRPAHTFQATPERAIDTAVAQGRIPRDMNEDVHTFTANLELPQISSRTAVRVAYDLVRSNAQYVCLLPQNSTLTRPQQLPPVRNHMQHATADMRYAINRRVALGIGYAYDQYDVEDFAMSPGALNSPVFSGWVNLMYQARPYDAHTGVVRLIYSW